MSLTLVIFLLVLGFLLMLLEVLVIPGVGVAGIAGAALLVAGVYGAYTVSTSTGHLVLGSSAVISGALLYFSLSRGTWKRMSLETEMTGRARENAAAVLNPGDRGEAVTRLNPSGKALIHNQLWEVTTFGDFVEEDQPVEVVKVEVNRIFVKSISA